MMSIIRQVVSLSIVFLSLARVNVVGAAEVQEFRVDTEIFIGEEKQPAAETLTLFTGGRVYDFLLTGPEEITLFDAQRGRFTLIDPARKVKSGISTQQLLEYVLSLESHAAESKDSLFKFASAPKFESSSEDVQEHGQSCVRLKLTGRPLEYVALARRPERAGAAREYRYFADWYARLNATRPGNLPPGARLELNKALADQELLPLEVTRTITPSLPLSKKIVARSRHLVNWTLGGEDRKRIDRVGTYLVEFPSVSFDEYRSASAQQEPAQQAKR